MNSELLTTYGIRGTEETGLTIELVWNIGKALADWLPTVGSVLVVAAPTEQRYGQAVIEGLRLQGRPVIDGGPLDRSVVLVQIEAEGLSGGVVVHTDEQEGVVALELLQHEAKVIEMSSGLQEIVDQALAGNFVPAAVKGELTAIV